MKLTARRQEYLFLKAIDSADHLTQFSDVVKQMKRISGEVRDVAFIYRPVALTKILNEQQEAGTISYSKRDGYALTERGRRELAFTEIGFGE